MPSTWTRVQEASSAGTNSVVLTGTTAGNLIVVYWGGYEATEFVAFPPSPTVPGMGGTGIEDTANNTYLLYSQSYLSNNGQDQIWAAANIAGGTVTINAYPVGTADGGGPSMIAVEYSCSNPYQIVGLLTIDQGKDDGFITARFMEQISGDTGTLGIQFSVAAGANSHQVAIALLDQFRDVVYICGNYDEHSSHGWTATGQIDGSPATATVIGYTTESGGQTGVLAEMFAPFIGSLALGITCNSPPSGIVGVAYSHAFPATAGVTPYTFSILSGSLPTSLTLNTSTGVVSGTPSAAGTFSFVIQVEDADSNTASVGCSITISAASALAISCNNPPNGLLGIPYSHFLTATGGFPPYSFSLSSGSLPPGLTLTPSGLISGTPTADGTYTFVAEVTDSASNTATVTCSITIMPNTVSGCRTTLFLWQAAVVPQPEITTDRIGDWTDCGMQSNKFFQGCKINADTFGQGKILQIQDADTGTLHVLQPSPIIHSGEQTLAYSFSNPFSAHLVRDVPQDVVPWRKFGIEYVFEATPEAAQTWQTQSTAHGMTGYHHIYREEFAYSANANLTITIMSFDGTSPQPITLPSTGGAYQRVLVTPTFNKGQLYLYSGNSRAPFQIYLEDCVTWVKQWGSGGPAIPYRWTGGSFGDKVKI